jgi:type III restriction enzyme
MDLRRFQIAASTQVANRFAAYMAEPLPRLKNTIVPFYQNIVALTGSGKTLILADTIEQARFRLPRGVEPIVFWISKGKVVVSQTYENLAHGKYASLIGGYDVKPLLECKPRDIADASRGLILIATAAKFNRAEREESDLRVFTLAEDWSKEPLWNLLKQRRSDDGVKRHLIVVYDEGHNLSDQQTQLLFELDPDALICATATPEYPKMLSATIARLLDEKGYTLSDLNTVVPTSEVVASGLIKKQIMLGGYVTPMEVAISDMLEEMAEASAAAAHLGLPFRPKAIYVSETNTIDGVGIKEDTERPFKQRKARPILIWRHLVENCGVDPSDIAVYLDLKFDRSQLPPSSFNLFKPGAAEYGAFCAGDYHHIIFNLSLQEGWDDPACGFAYVDKPMGSSRQITQLIGRLLRQPGAQHYSAASLNIAHWFIRTDEKSVFKEILDEIKAKLGRDIPAEVTIAFRETRRQGEKHILEARKERVVPTPSVYSLDAQPKIKKVIRSIIDLTSPSESTIGTGNRIRVLQSVGSGDEVTEEWKESAHSNPVMARWILRRELARGHS